MLPDPSHAPAPPGDTHGNVRRSRIALLAPALLALAARAQEKPPDETRAVPSGAPAADASRESSPPLAVVNGVVRSLDLAAHTVQLDVGGDVQTLGLDRNTLVYVAGGLSTVFALRPGDEVRAGRNGQAVAYWIQVLRAPAPGAPPASPPGQGTGPGGESAPPPGEAGPGPSPPTVGGGVQP